MQDEKSPGPTWLFRSAQYRNGEGFDNDINDFDEFNNHDHDLVCNAGVKVMVACLYIGIGFFGYLKFGPDVKPVSLIIIIMMMMIIIIVIIIIACFG